MLLALDGDGPLYRQAYRALRGRILDGSLAPGTRLPATRDLARTLSLSRNTVVSAYRELVDEGYAEARTGSGTSVAKGLPEAGLSTTRTGVGEGGRQTSPAPRLSRAAQRMLGAAPDHGLSWELPRRSLEYDFRYGEPAYADLPLETWQRLVGRFARRASARHLAYSAPGGSPELRNALAGYLSRSRGVVCAPEQIVLTYGSQQAIDLTARLLLDEGDRVAVEEPHYTGLSLSLVSAGAQLIAIPVDEAGIIPEALERAGPLRLVCLTPSHQFPTGGILPLARRTAVLEISARRDAFVLEDDYDSELRYDARPVECLQGLDPHRVIYTGSASKLLFPSLRIGWAVVPPALAGPFATAKALADTSTAGLEQLALAAFIEDGGLERHVRRMRVRCGARRQALLAAVSEELGERVVVRGENAGLHLLLELPALPRARASELRKRCARRSVGLYPAAPYYDQPPEHASFLLGYAALDEDRIAEGIRRLSAALDEVTD